MFEHEQSNNKITKLKHYSPLINIFYILHEHAIVEE